MVRKGRKVFNAFETVSFGGNGSISFDTLPALCVSRDMLGLEFKAGLVFPNTEVPLSFALYPSSPNVDILTDANGDPLTTTTDGDLVVLITGDAGHDPGAATVPVFDIHGLPEDVDRFRRRLASSAYAGRFDYEEAMLSDLGDATTTNPFEFARRYALANGAVLVVLNLAEEDSSLIQRGMDALKSTYPAGAILLMHMEKTTDTEESDLSDSETVYEDVSPFLVFTTQELLETDDLQVVDEHITKSESVS
jgi:hypothetical protein